MLEILFVRWFYRFLANAAEEKGQSRGWGMLGVGLWFGGEITGLVLGFASGGAEAAAYGFALLTAGLGAAIAFGVVQALPNLTVGENAPLEF